MHLLAISGSLRAQASNTVLLEAAALIAPPDVEVVRYEGLATLPPFNPDLDTPERDALPQVVTDLRARIGHTDGVLISSPEYAHGIPGALKNLLDWLVGSVELPGKPVALLNTSPLSVHAPAQLAEVLTTMNAHLVAAACVTVPLLGRRLDAAGIAADAELGPALRTALTTFVREISDWRAERAVGRSRASLVR
jgi:NAD(P)H-dependent FMN reductase